MIAVCKLPIAPSKLFALCLTDSTPAKFVACEIWFVKSLRCAVVICVKVPRCCFAAFWAAINFASPFNASFAVFTRCNAASTAFCAVFGPVDLFKIAFAAVIALSYSCCLFVSASRYFSEDLTWDSLLIPFCKLAIAWSRCCAFCFTVSTPLTLVALLIWLIKLFFWASVILVNVFKYVFAFCFAVAKFSSPLSAVLELFTCSAFCVIVLGFISGLLFALIIVSAAATALLYAVCLSLLAST